MKNPKDSNKAEIRTEIEFCSECPKSRISPIYGSSVLKEDVYCTELKRVVHAALDWKEIMAEHQIAYPEHDNSMDRIPDDCPFIKKTSEQ